jgi:hypothetical protein
MDNHGNREWTGLFKIGAISAAVIVLVYIIELVVILIFGLPPTTAEGWFGVLQKNRLAGLIQTFALDLVAEIFHVALFVALFFLLKQTKKLTSTLILSTAFALIGFAVYFASNITFSMLYLSDQFAATTLEAQKSQLLTSAQTLLAVYNGSGPFIAFFLLALSGILVSIVMLRSQVFAKWVAILGIVGYTLELGLPPSIDPPWFLQIDPLLIGIGGVILIIWYIAISVQFYKISRLPM